MANKLKIALIGYGKMGQMIEKVAVDRGHEIVSKIDVNSTEEDWKVFSQADVAIEFTKPDSASDNIIKAFTHNVPVVVGTTGWYSKYEFIKLLCLQNERALLTASNFSIGVNLFFHINKLLAKAMENYPEYNVELEEIHHTQKLDAPSGTAITIAEGILSELKRKQKWALSNEVSDSSDLAITALREDDVPGTHSVKYSSEIDTIEIKHTAHNRTGFALGAVVAAEWLHNKKGVYTMNDIIGF
ncbi:MAG: 4-hydroxy-tetrahydrodipicolinate reductase [Bacteroidia bacterium]